VLVVTRGKTGGETGAEHEQAGAHDC